jgi:HAD superfamily hydrolase (TIGR01509 family)
MSALRAVFFDQDGVIVDTERTGHRVAFNQAFDEFGLDVFWDEVVYHDMLQVGGGKERIRHHYDTRGFGKPVEHIDGLIRALHQRKTEIFLELLESGSLPLRPGVHRLMREINHAGLVLGISTTSNERNARAIAEGLLRDIRFDFVLAGDVVPHKKPDPAIYQLAQQRAGVPAEACLVVEDSHIGVTAARAAGMHVLATVNGYTRNEDLSAADWVVDCLGDPEGEPATALRGPAEIVEEGCVTLASVERALARD